jgi:hypothetical protein
MCEPHIQSGFDSNEKSHRQSYEFIPVCLVTDVSWFIVDRSYGRTVRCLDSASTGLADMAETEPDSSVRIRANKHLLRYDTL